MASKRVRRLEEGFLGAARVAAQGSNFSSLASEVSFRCDPSRQEASEVVATGASDLDRLLFIGCGGSAVADDAASQKAWTGLAAGRVIEFCGERRSGKTQVQVCHALAAGALLGAQAVGHQTQADEDTRHPPRRVVYIDTQRSFRAERLSQILTSRLRASRFDGDKVAQEKDEHPGVADSSDTFSMVDAAMERLVYARCRSSSHMEELTENICELVSSTNNRDSASAPSRFGLIVVDSLDGVLCEDYVAEHYGSRTNSEDLAQCWQSLERCLARLRWCAEAFGVAVVVTNFAMKDNHGQCERMGGRFLSHHVAATYRLEEHHSAEHGLRSMSLCSSLTDDDHALEGPSKFDGENSESISGVCFRICASGVVDAPANDDEEEDAGTLGVAGHVVM